MNLTESYQESPIFKKDIISCMGCMSTYDKNSKDGIMCNQSHFICSKNGCDKNFLNLDYIHQKEELKCPICFIDIDFDPLSKYSNLEELSKLFKKLSKRPGALKQALLEDETIEFCQFCNYFEINLKSEFSGQLFFTCKDLNCGRMVCIGCSKEVLFTEEG